MRERSRSPSVDHRSRWHRRTRLRGNVAPDSNTRCRRPENQNGPVQVEALAVPVRRCRVCVDRDAGGGEVPICRCMRLARPVRGRWCVGKRSAIWPEEAGVNVIPQLDGESLLVNGPAVTSTEQQEVVESRRTAGGPVAHVVRIAMAGIAAGEPAPAVPSRQRAPDGGRDGAGLAPDVEHGAVRAVAHDDSGSIARDAARRLRGNVDAVFVFQCGLSLPAVIPQDTLIDVDDDLIAITSSSAVEIGSQGALGEQAKRVGAPLAGRGACRAVLFPSGVRGVGRVRRVAVQPVFLKRKETEESHEGDFFVRRGPGTVKLTPESARDFIRTRFAPVVPKQSQEAPSFNEGG